VTDYVVNADAVLCWLNQSLSMFC